MTFVHCGLEGGAHSPAGHRDCTTLSSGHQDEPREETVSPTEKTESPGNRLKEEEKLGGKKEKALLSCRARV